MKVLRFTLSGKEAFFKNPEMNSHYYFTYGHIHKVALLGLFGAILGYGGYTEQTAQKQVPDFPEFYERLKELQISVIPICESGNFMKKMVTFNNSVGYASQEKGGNLVVKQQWIEQPKWYIYVAQDCPEAEKLATKMLEKKCVYIPYLGSNDHPANITDVQIIEADLKKEPNRIDSLCKKELAVYDLDDEEQDRPYKYEEALPYALDKELNMHILQSYVISNLAVEQAKCDVYEIQDIDEKKYHIVFG